jgi:hypothetical protein
MVSDSDMEDTDDDFGFEINFKREAEKAKLSLSELLGRFTNATDTVTEIIEASSDSGSLVSD